MDAYATSCTDSPSTIQNRQDRITDSAPDNGRGKIRTHRASARSLLCLRILVQNRRKSKEPILVFGSRAQVVAYPSLAILMLNGLAEGDNIVPFSKDGYVVYHECCQVYG